MNRIKRVSVTGLRAVNWRGRWGIVLKLLISAGLIALILFFVDFEELADIAANSNPWYLIAAAVLIYFDRLLMTYKWNLLLLALDVRVPYSLLLRTYLVSPLAQILLPSTIGADLFRLYNLSLHKVDAQAVFASIFMERVIGFVAILLLILIGFGLAFYVVGDSWTHMAQLGWAVIATAAIGAFLLLALFAVYRLLIPKLAARLSQNPLMAKLRRVYMLSSEYRERRRALAVVFVWTFIEQLVVIGVVYLIVQSFHTNVSLLELLAIIPLTVLAQRLPISIDGLGGQEGVYVAVFGLVGVPPSEALLLSTSRRGVQLLCFLPWGFHYIYKGQQPALPEQRVITVNSQ